MYQACITHVSKLFEDEWLADAGAMSKILLILIMLAVLRVNLFGAEEQNPFNIADHASHKESVDGMRARLINYKMKRLAAVDKGLLICLFVMERRINEPNFVELRVLKDGRRAHMIPVDEVESFPLKDQSIQANQEVVLSIMYAEIPLTFGSYNLEVHDRTVKFYEDTRIDPGRASIITHFADLNNSSEPPSELILGYKQAIHEYLLKYENFMLSVDYQLGRKGLQQLVIELSLDYNESFHRPISRIDLSRATLTDHSDKVLDIILKNTEALKYLGTQTIQRYQQQSTVSNYQLNFRYPFSPDGSPQQCLNLTLDADLLKQEISASEREALGRNGKILINDFVCMKDSKRQEFEYSRRELIVQRQRDGIWKIKFNN